MLFKLGAIHTFLVFEKKTHKGHKLKFIKFSIKFYKNTPYFKHIKLISRPSKMYPISLRSLKVIKSFTGQSTYILSTSRGLKTNEEALKSGLSGIVLCIVN